ncbi:MAG TPA: IS66 family insertion sequence element accessory protein TnpB [Candidatus Competibacteraceae bacterium]|nr:IS66 family insertion sequence element accessory protein TnpB [Candidatus Competibacteraceae bacterium]
MDTANRAVLEWRLFWQDHLGQWQRSGLTQVAYCRQQGLKVAQFGYWKKRLLPPQAPDAAPGATPGFIPVQRASVGAAVAVVLNERLRVEVYPGFDPATLRALVQALGGDVPA